MLELAKKLSSHRGKTIKVIIVANSSKSHVIVKVFGVPILFQGLKKTVNFVVLRKFPFEFVIDRPTLKRLGNVLDFESELLWPHYNGA